MDMSLNGRRAVVTAAGQGIGRAIAEQLVQEGADVLATDVNPDLLTELTCETAQLDVMDQRGIQELLTKGPEIDVLCNCAGYVANGALLDTSDEDWYLSFDLNVRSMFWTIKSVLPGMLDRGRGSIVNIGSVVSSVKSVSNRFAYASSKAAVIGLTKAIAIDHINDGIRANVICPGTVNSPSLQQRLQASGNYEAALKAFVARQPLGRLGTPEEIASLAAFLASDKASFITGACYTVDGGMTL